MQLLPCHEFRIAERPLANSFAGLCAALALASVMGCKQRTFHSEKNTKLRSTQAASSELQPAGNKTAVSYFTVCRVGKTGYTFPLQSIEHAPVVSSNPAEPPLDFFNAPPQDVVKFWAQRYQEKNECLPDTLYRWTSAKSAQAFVMQFEQLAATKKGMHETVLPSPAFFWRTAMGSFAYGERSVRVKLKEGLRFIYVPLTSPSGVTRDCPLLAKLFNVHGSVFVSDLEASGYHEYFLCSYGPVHSLSLDTPEHLQEQESEAAWIKTHEPNESDLIIKHHGRWLDVRAGFEFDDVKWTVEKLDQRVEGARVAVRESPQGQGTLLFAPDARRTHRAEHFSSRLTAPWLSLGQTPE